MSQAELDYIAAGGGIFDFAANLAGIITPLVIGFIVGDIHRIELA